MDASVALHPAENPRKRSLEARRAARRVRFERERLIVDFLNRGLSVVEIAQRLGVTEKRMRALVKEILARRMPPGAGGIRCAAGEPAQRGAARGLWRDVAREPEGGRPRGEDRARARPLPRFCRRRSPRPPRPGAGRSGGRGAVAIVERRRPVHRPAERVRTDARPVVPPPRRFAVQGRTAPAPAISSPVERQRNAEGTTRSVVEGAALRPPVAWEASIARKWRRKRLKRWNPRRTKARSRTRLKRRRRRLNPLAPCGRTTSRPDRRTTPCRQPPSLRNAIPRPQRPAPARKRRRKRLKTLVPRPETAGSRPLPGRAGKRLLLAPGTIEGRPAGLREAGDRSAAAAPRAAETFAVVDGKPMLEITEIAVRLSMVAQRRASGLDRLFEHGADGLCQRAGGARRISRRVGEDAGRTQGRKPGAKKRFAHVYIAEAGDPLLVEQGALERRARACKQLRQPRGVEFQGQRLFPKPDQSGMRLQGSRPQRDP